MAKITITFNEILFDLQNKNREEVRSISDSQARYFAEAGSEKSYELTRSINEAFSQVSSMYLRFVKNATQLEATDVLNGAEDLMIEFEISERRSKGKIQPITDTLHSLIVNHALTKFYNDIQQPELAAKRAQQTAEDAKLLNKLLFEKLPPL